MSIDIFVNEEKIRVDKGKSLRQILEGTSAPYAKDAIIALGKGQNFVSEATGIFILETTKGSIFIEVTSKKQRKLWGQILKHMSMPTKINFETPSYLFFGSFDLNVRGNYKNYEIREGDVLLSLMGLDPHNVSLVISKKKHEAFYSIPDGEMLGRVNAGWEVLSKLDRSDLIKSVSPFLAQDLEQRGFLKIRDLDLKITQNGTRINTFMKALMSKDVPESTELFLFSSRNNTFEVSSSTYSYIVTGNLQGFGSDEKNLHRRIRGDITIRNIGKGMGKIFIYKRDHFPVPSHTVIGKVVQGMVLVDLAREGDLIMVETDPPRINLIGLKQSDAERYLLKLNLRQKRCRDNSNSSVVVEQKPLHTINIQKAGCLETFGVVSEKVLKIKIYNEKAPKSAEFFKVQTGLYFNTIGSLKVLFPPSTMVGAVLFESGAASKMPLPPENVPALSRKGDIGITNQIEKKVGSVGIRMMESDEFGPTCESLEATNIIGRVKDEDLFFLKNVKKGEKIYFKLED